VSSSVVRLHAGWYGESLWPGGRSAVPSEAERFLVWPFERTDWKLTDGDPSGASPEDGCCCGSLPESVLGRFFSQYFSKTVVSFLSSANLLPPFVSHMTFPMHIRMSGNQKRK
jgi:hypothetical protein